MIDELSHLGSSAKLGRLITAISGSYATEANKSRVVSISAEKKETTLVKLQEQNVR